MDERRFFLVPAAGRHCVSRRGDEIPNSSTSLRTAQCGLVAATGACERWRAAVALLLHQLQPRLAPAHSLPEDVRVEALAGPAAVRATAAAAGPGVQVGLGTARQAGLGSAPGHQSAICLTPKHNHYFKVYLSSSRTMTSQLPAS